MNLKLILKILVINSLFFASFNLYAVQIQFANGDVFHAELIYEDERNLAIKFKGKDYKIPKRELEYFDLSNQKTLNTSYTLTTFKLKNGSIIRGQIADQKNNEFIIKTEIGFLSILQSDIVPPIPIKTEYPEISEKYLTKVKDTNQTIIGGSFSFLPTLPPLSEIHPQLYGISVFAEPAYLKFGTNWQGGIKIEHFRGDFGNNRLSIQSGSIYGIYNHIFMNNEYLNFYSLASIGLSQVSYTNREGENFGGTNSNFGFDIGWQTQIKQSHILRIGIKNTCFMETQGLICGSGIEMQGGISF